MTKRVRLSLEISEDLSQVIDDVAEREGVTRTEIVRRALAIVVTFKEQMRIGRTHLGFAADADKLDLELVGVLTPRTT